MEPDLIVQTAEPASAEERKAWIMEQIDIARSRGLGFFRASFNLDHSLLLLEGWKEQPEDQGEARFDLSAVLHS